MEALYQRFGPALIRQAERVTKSRADAEDIVHALFVQLMDRGPWALSFPYLFRAVTRRSLNLLRDEGNRQRLIDEGAPVLAPPPTAAPSGEREDLYRLLATLSPKLREVFVYRHLTEMPQDEIAEVVGVSRKTVQKRLTKLEGALETLRAEAAHG